MKTLYRKYSLIFSAGALIMSPQIVHAQGYHGSYTPTSREQSEDMAKRPTPRIFSSKISNEQVGKRLDDLYNNLFVSLWLYALTDMNHQAALFELIVPEKFQYTRYIKEFKPTMDDAMSDLNKNYKRMMSDINQADASYETIKSIASEQDQNIIDELWVENMSSFKKSSNKYFQLQGGFLKTYNGFVSFVIKNTGSYYFDSTERRVKFYDLGEYTLFGAKIDKLRKISYQQRVLLKENAPANPTISFE